MATTTRKPNGTVTDINGKPVSLKGETTIEQGVFVVPDIPIKELLDAIPAHCFKRSAIRSSVYIFWDLAVILACFHGTTLLAPFIPSASQSISSYVLSQPFLAGPTANPTVLKTAQTALTYVQPALYLSLWALYGFFSGLFATGLWVIAHECGHQAFSESKTINNTVGWVLHSALGVPYHSWRITHAKHHASTGHMTQDQVFVPHTRGDLQKIGKALSDFDPAREDRLGARVTEEVKRELWEALGDSPIGAVLGSAQYLLGGWPAYLIRNASGQPRYPKGTNHFTPSAAMFAPHHYWQILVSDLGILLWLAGIGFSIKTWGLLVVFGTYLIPYLWVNHWLVLITFLQHTDPLLPHYRAPEFTFARGALATFDRQLLGDLGRVAGWLGAHATNGISETHVLHHVSSKIPHYNAWEASAALRRKLESHGMKLDGRPGGWAEVYRVYKECKFVEDEGDVVFFKNAHGLAQMRPVFNDLTASDSGIEIEK